MVKEMRDFDRRGRRARRLMAWSLLAVPAVVVLTLVVGLVARADPASGASPGLQPLHGRQGQVPPGATLLGPAPSSTVLPLTVTLQPRDPAGLAAEAAAVSDPASPEYHHFLTPRQFAERYGPTAATIAEVSASLRDEGLTVGTPSSTGLSLPVSGNVAQVQSAFATPIDRYQLSSGKTGYDNRSVPKVPSTIAPQVQGIIGLDTLSPPRPTASLPAPAAGGGRGAGGTTSGTATGGTAIGSATGGSAAAAGAATAGGTPALASGQPSPVAGSCASSISSVESTYGALDAPELAQAYSFGSPYSAGDYGAGTTVALVELSGAGYSSSDINAFATCYGITLANGQVTQRTVSGGGATGGGTVEAELDIDTVLSMAPKANIEVYEGGPTADVYDVLNQIVSDDTAKVVSVSWTNGCEAYVGSSMQNAENTLLQSAAVDGQSVFVASGDQGSEGCNVNGVIAAPTGAGPVAQVVDSATGTLYVANKSGNTLSVDGEGTASNPSNFSAASTVTTGTAPDAVALATASGKVFVANASSNSLTTVSTATCNRTTTSGCGSPTQILSGGHLSGPSALAVSGSTLYVGNTNGTVAVYDAGTNGFVGTVTLPVGSSPSAVAVDGASGMAYVADGSNNRVEYFNTATCNATTSSGCSTLTVSSVAVGNGPASLAVDDAVGSLYVGNGGTNGGISVVSLSTQALTTTISTGHPAVNGMAGTGVVRSVGLSPDGNEVLAVLDGLTFPGDVLATVNPLSQTITATVNLQTGTHTMGALASDTTRDYVWVTDQTANDDVVQNLNLGVSDPASQPFVTSVGGTSVSALGPAPTESTWNDQLHYAEGGGGGGISRTFTMPGFQQPLGTVTGSSGTPCANANGNCREVPDVSADADPSTGYVIYDAVNGLGWTAIGGTSGAAPLWAAVLAVAASANGNTVGYGDMNPILYQLAQQSPGTYLNDVTTGNNDLNGTDNQQFPAMSGYDMATGLGTPVTSSLVTGLTEIPLDVAVSGSQVYGGTPTFTATPSFGGSNGTPFGVAVNSAGFSCTEVGTSTPITTSLAAGSYTLLASSCSGVSLSGANAGDYTLVLTSASGDFTVTPAPVSVGVSGTQTYGGSPAFSGSDSPPAGITVDTTGLTCTEIQPFGFITPSLAAGSHTLFSGSCSGATLSGTNASDYAPSYVSTAGNFTVTPAPLTVTGSSPSMTYGSAPPTITALYSGFVNGDTASSLTTAPTCSTAATSTSTVAGSPYASSCSGAVDPNYSITYSAGFVTVTQAPLLVTASSPTMPYGSTPPVITPQYSGFENGETAAVLTPQPTCSTTATSTSPPSTYPSSCSGGAAANYALSYAAGSVTVAKAVLTVTASSGTMPYGGTPPGITPSYSGFVNGDDVSALSTLPACTTPATSGSGVAGSPYPSTCSGAAAADYTFSYVAGTVTVTKMPLTVTASDGTMTYGGAPATITPSYSGFVNGDTASSLTTAPACTSTATSTSTVAGSPYVSSCSAAVDANYSLTYDPGTVTVGQAPLTVTASSPTMHYGSVPPPITALYSGFMNGETAAVLTAQPVCSGTATSTSTVAGSPYASSCSGAAADNYTISYAGGATTVTPAPISVAVTGSQSWGGSPSFSATPAPPPAGVTVDASAVTCSQVAPSTAITPGLGGGSYTLVTASCRGATLSGSDAADYAVSYTAAAGSFSVIGGPPPPPPPPPHGYWLVGSDGGIFTFGSAHFFGSTGSMHLQRPVVGITPTADQGGYWLVASDGGIFAFGDAGFFGSIPGLGLAPAGSGLPHALNAPIVGMVPSADGGGYFMVASDGGVFAFGDAQFEGSCPGIGGCSGAAVSVVPDASGRGYWLVTKTGSVYTFGDAPYYGAPGPQSSPITAAVRSADGAGYYVLLANGTVDGYGDAVPRGGPVGAVGGLNPASAVFTDAGGGGYWVASATGAVYTYGDAPADGSMAGTPLNGSIIAATGF